MIIGLSLISLILAVAIGGATSVSDISNQMYKLPSASTIISIIAIAIAAWSLIISRTVEKDRQKEIRTAILTAQLNKRIVDANGHYEFTLEIMNQGKAAAKEIEILIEGNPAEKYINLIWGAQMFGGLGENGIIDELDAGTNVEYPLYYGVGDPARMNIELRWSDGLEKRHTSKKFLLPKTVGQ